MEHFYVVHLTKEYARPEGWHFNFVRKLDKMVQIIIHNTDDDDDDNNNKKKNNKTFIKCCFPRVQKCYLQSQS